MINVAIVEDEQEAVEYLSAKAISAMLTAFFASCCAFLKGGGRLDCSTLSPIFAGRLHSQPVYFVAANAEKVRSI